MSEERFEFTGQAKKKVFTTLAIGLALLVFGIVGLSTGFLKGSDSHGGGHGGGHHSSVLKVGNELAQHDEHGDAHHVEATEAEHGHEGAAHVEGAHAEPGHEGAHAEEGHHEKTVWSRIVAALWLNNTFFTGIAVVGLFFVCLQYVTWAGWSSLVIRPMLSLGWYLPIGFVVMLVVFFAGGHELFHWTDAHAVETDPVLAGKASFLNTPFFLIRLGIYFGLWILVFFLIKKNMQREDELGGTKFHDRIIQLSAVFLVIFAVTSSAASWDWLMSTDAHWFSTMWGWYVFASWLVTGVAVMTYLVISLKEAGYLKFVSANHIHDLGKFMFAFSIFWTYIWFCQFMLYWYSNIPEEGIWFYERMFNYGGKYAPFLVINLIINFAFPFFFLMSRDSKRQGGLLKVAAVMIFIGHWIDFYLIIYPPVVGNLGGLDLGLFTMELGMTLVFVAIFTFAMLTGLSKLNLVANNHPMLDESKHHHI